MKHLELETMQPDVSDLVTQLKGELENFEEIARYLIPQPGDLPRLRGIQVHGGTIPLNGLVGGDHIIYVDFKKRFDLDARIRHGIEEGNLDLVENLKRCQTKAGIAVLDVSGHRITDGFMSAMLHQAFLLGSIYELDMFGEVTRRLFENLNTRFYNSSSAQKFVSLIYGEISEDTGFRFLSAGHPAPMVFSSKHNRFMDVSQDAFVSSPPLGMLPSLEVTDRRRTESLLGFKAEYEMNEWVLMGDGDILLLHTDGLSEHSNGDDDYVPARLEQTVRDVKHLPAAGIYEAITADMLAFGPPSDDISLVVVKRASRSA
jgi:serine phosphatase RsbU (regulator of sigma subunit)